MLSGNRCFTAFWHLLRETVKVLGVVLMEGMSDTHPKTCRNIALAQAESLSCIQT